jgi:hypothetical protein
MERLRVSHTHNQVSTAMLITVLLKKVKLVPFMYHMFTQVFQDSMLRNFNTAQISMKGLL